MKLLISKKPSNQHSPNQDQAIRGGAAIIAIVFLAISTVAFGGLAVWTISRYNTVLTSVNEQKEIAAAEAREIQRQESEVDFANREKEPFRTYEAPSVFGGFSVSFPRVWNVYAVEASGGGTPVDVYMHPEVVRSSKGAENTYALRIQLTDKLYPEAIKPYTAAAKKSEVSATAIAVSGITGTRFDGKIDNVHTGSIVLLPIRDKTLAIWTESEQFVADYNKILELAAISR